MMKFDKNSGNREEKTNQKQKNEEVDNKLKKF